MRNCRSPTSSSSSLLSFARREVWLVGLNIFNSSRSSSFVNFCIGERKSSSSALEQEQIQFNHAWNNTKGVSFGVVFFLFLATVIRDNVNIYIEIFFSVTIYSDLWLSIRLFREKRTRNCRCHWSLREVDRLENRWIEFEYLTFWKEIRLNRWEWRRITSNWKRFEWYSNGEEWELVEVSSKSLDEFSLEDLRKKKTRIECLNSFSLIVPVDWEFFRVGWLVTTFKGVDRMLFIWSILEQDKKSKSLLLCRWCREYEEQNNSWIVNLDFYWFNYCTIIVFGWLEAFNHWKKRMVRVKEIFYLLQRNTMIRREIVQAGFVICRTAPTLFRLFLGGSPNKLTNCFRNFREQNA